MVLMHAKIGVNLYLPVEAAIRSARQGLSDHPQFVSGAQRDPLMIWSYSERANFTYIYIYILMSYLND